MKRELLSYDSLNAEPSRLGRSGFFHDLIQEHARIVARYVSGFASPRDALGAMLKGDEVHVPGEWSQSHADGHVDDLLDNGARNERDRVIRGVVENLGFATRPETRFARRELDRLLDERRIETGIDPLNLAYSAILQTTTSRGKKKQTLVLHGPHPNPLIHAYAWMQMIVRPTLLAHEHPAAFFRKLAPRWYGPYFDTSAPQSTIPRWGHLSLSYNPDLIEAFFRLAANVRRHILSKTLLPVMGDGGTGDIHSHEERLKFYEAARAGSVKRGAARIARQKTAEKFDVGIDMVKYSCSQARRLRKIAAIPPDRWDFVIANGEPLYVGPGSA